MIQIKVKNIKNLENAFKKYGDNAVKEFSNIVKLTGQQIEGKAKELAPVDNGQLRQSIRNEQKGKLDTKITAYMPYSAYMEFGTGGLVDIPTGWETMAAQFKGKGIKQVNILPHPFMYPAFLYGKSIFNKDLEDSIKDLNKKFNNG